MIRRVALTGATGFLGRRLCDVLGEAGLSVRALARRPPSDVERPPEWVAGDLADEAALERLVAGADVVVHAAGLIKARSAAEFDAVNVEGARRLARNSSGTPLIHVSSLVAREPGLSPYAASKAAGERAVRALAPDVVIVRPPAIYGPGDRETLGLFRLAQSAPAMVAPGPPEARVALAHVDDVAGAILGLIHAPPSGATITLGGARASGYSWGEITETALGAFGRRAPLVSLPAPLVRTAGRASEFVAKLRGEATIFTSGKAREMLHRDWSVSDAEQGPLVNFGYRSLPEGFASTIDWYRRHGWIR